MPLLAGSILLQIACAIHCLVTKRHVAWLLLLVMFPVVGPLAYFLFEIFPSIGRRRDVKAVKEAAVKVIDPERALRAAREALDTADTVANRTALGNALAGLGRWHEAVTQYEMADAKTPVSVDRTIRLRLATACFEAGRSARARALLESLPPSGPQSERDRIELLHARILEEAGEAERALAIYADIGERLPGAEAQCRRAGLLLSLGRRAEAMKPLVDAGRRAKHIDPYMRARDRDMYDWAAETLAELRAEPAQPGG